jgi:hypothetical protein
VFLSEKNQKSLPFKTSELLKNNPQQFPRKNIGYLVAMTQGAEVIYDTEEGQMPIQVQGLQSQTLPVETSLGTYKRPLLRNEDAALASVSSTKGCEQNIDAEDDFEMDI